MVTTWRSWLPQVLVLAAAALWIYSPAFVGTWVWDDESYLASDPCIHDPQGFWRVWFHLDGQGDYYPLTAFVRWAEWHLWGEGTLGYHLVNIGLHIASGFLIWRLFARLGLSLAWLGGLLFIVHPVMVESVAWIAELKNTLSLPPLLLAMLAWLDWKERRDPSFYRTALTWFIVSLLAKTSGVMLPLVFLGYEWWKKGKVARDDLRAIAPFFAIALVAGAVSVFFHPLNTDPEKLQPNWNLLAALACIGWSSLFLLGVSLWPVGLLPDYPGYAGSTPTLFDLLPWVCLTVLGLLLWRTRAGWGRHLLFGLGFFFLNLAPVLLYILLKYSIMAWSMDHLVYLPIIGLLGLAVAGLGWIDRRLVMPLRVVEWLVVSVSVMLMACGSHAYSGWYQNSKTLWTWTLERFPNSYTAAQNLGADMIAEGRFADAATFVRQVLALRPGWSDSHNNMGLILEKTGQTAAALEEYQEAVRLNPSNGKACLNLASSLIKAGRRDEAMEQYRQAVKLNPDLAQLRYDLGTLLLEAHDLPGAIEHLQAAVNLDPTIAPSHENLGSALAQSGRPVEAAEQFSAAVEINPAYVIARNNLARALVQAGRIPEAIDQCQKVLQIDPTNAQAQANLVKLQQFEMQQKAPGNP